MNSHRALKKKIILHNKRFVLSPLNKSEAYKAIKKWKREVKHGKEARRRERMRGKGFESRAAGENECGNVLERGIIGQIGCV